MKAMKEKIKSIYKNLLFSMSANENPILLGFYRNFYISKKTSVSDFLDRYSKSVEFFTVIQVGANDGFNHDPIHKFIKRDNWNGVLLEPQKYVFDKYLKRLYKNRQEVITLNAALGESDGERPIYKISFTNARWATGLASFQKSTLIEAFTNGYVKRRATKNNTPVPNNISDCISEEKVQVISPETLFEKYKIAKLDLLQIDAEGADFIIIKLFNPGVYKPQAIIFEHSHFSIDEDLECTNYLQNFDYKLYKKGGNTIAVYKDVSIEV